MTKRICSECPQSIEAGARGGRCVECQRTYERSRGSSAARGYGYDHRARRAALEPIVSTGMVRCWRCDLPIEAGVAWDLGHADRDPSTYRGPEHVACNRATSGR